MHETSPSSVTRCLVIGPIGDRHAPADSEERQTYEESLEVFDKVIAAACHACGLEASRADSLPEPGEITEQVFRALRDEALVIADVTNGNPDVMYELGLRHTRDKATIMIAEYRRVPSPLDISIARAIVFVRTEAGLVDGRTRLEEAIRAAQAGRFDQVSATRLWAELFPRTEGDLPPPASAEEVEEPPGVLDLMSETSETLQSLTGLVRAHDSHRRVLALTTKMNKEIEDAGKAAEPLKQQREILDRAATAYEAEAARLEAFAQDFEGRTATILRGGSYVMDWAERNPDYSQLREAAASFGTMAHTSALSISKLAAASERAMAAVAKRSARLAIPSRRIITTYGRLSAACDALLPLAQRADALSP